MTDNPPTVDLFTLQLATVWRPLFVNNGEPTVRFISGKRKVTPARAKRLFDLSVDDSEDVINSTVRWCCEQHAEFNPLGQTVRAFFTERLKTEANTLAVANRRYDKRHMVADEGKLTVDDIAAGAAPRESGEGKRRGTTKYLPHSDDHPKRLLAGTDTPSIDRTLLSETHIYNRVSHPSDFDDVLFSVLGDLLEEPEALTPKTGRPSAEFMRAISLLLEEIPVGEVVEITKLSSDFVAKIQERIPQIKEARERSECEKSARENGAHEKRSEKSRAGAEEGRNELGEYLRSDDYIGGDAPDRTYQHDKELRTGKPKRQRFISAGKLRGFWDPKQASPDPKPLTAAQRVLINAARAQWEAEQKAQRIPQTPEETAEMRAYRDRTRGKVWVDGYLVDIVRKRNDTLAEKERALERGRRVLQTNGALSTAEWIKARIRANVDGRRRAAPSAADDDSVAPESDEEAV